MTDFCPTSEFVNNSSLVFTIPVKHVQYVVCQSCMHLLIIQRNITALTTQRTLNKNNNWVTSPVRPPVNCKWLGLIQYSRPLTTFRDIINIYRSQTKQVTHISDQFWPMFTQKCVTREQNRTYVYNQNDTWFKKRNRHVFFSPQEAFCFVYKLKQNDCVVKIR